MNRHIPITITLTRPLAPTVKKALSSLRQTFPQALTHPPRPLATDVLSVAQQHLATQHSKKSIRRALSAWCNQMDYLQAVTRSGACCVHLDGSEAGPVTETQRQQAQRRLDRKGSLLAAPSIMRQPVRHARPPAPLRFPVEDQPSAWPTKTPEADETGPRISVRQRPKLPDKFGDKSIQPTRRPKLTLKKTPSESS